MNEQLLLLLTELTKMRINFFINFAPDDCQVVARYWVRTLSDGEIIAHPFVCNDDVAHSIRFVQGEDPYDDEIQYIWTFIGLESVEEK